MKIVKDKDVFAVFRIKMRDKIEQQDGFKLFQKVAKTCIALLKNSSK